MFHVILARAKARYSIAQEVQVKCEPIQHRSPMLWLQRSLQCSCQGRSLLRTYLPQYKSYILLPNDLVRLETASAASRKCKSLTLSWTKLFQTDSDLACSSCTAAAKDDQMEGNPSRNLLFQIWNDDTLEQLRWVVKVSSSCSITQVGELPLREEECSQVSHNTDRSVMLYFQSHVPKIQRLLTSSINCFVKFHLPGDTVIFCVYNSLKHEQFLRFPLAPSACSS